MELLLEKPVKPRFKPIEILRIKRELRKALLKSKKLNKWLAIDFLCGAGGVTLGINNSEVAQVIACLNHDGLALKTHKANHSEAVHFEADVTEMLLEVLEEFVGIIDIIWISPDCTHHSNAKGGGSRDADSRMLAEQLYRYASYLKPKYIFVENVREFLNWGPVIEQRDENGNIVYENKVIKDPSTGKPIKVKDPVTGKKVKLREWCKVMISDKRYKAKFYNEWVRTLKELGWVNYEYRLLNCADYGSPTKRLRYFGIFSLENCPITWPLPTHDEHGRYGLPKWKPCKDYINLENEGESIFGRKIPLVHKTLKRIAYGIKKHGLSEEERAFIMKYYEGEHNSQSINVPMHSITTKDRMALIQLEIDEQFLIQYYGRDDAGQSLDKPINVIPTNNRNALITVKKRKQFITQHIWGDKDANQVIDEPLNTILTEDVKQLITIDYLIQEEKKDFILNYLSKGIKNNPNTAADIKKETEKRQFIDKYFSGETNVQSLDEPLGAIKTNPSLTLITTEMWNSIILDVKFRHLNAEELKLCQGFPADYLLLGSEEVKKRFIGNSVPPQPVMALIESNYYGYHAQFEKMA